MSRFAAEFGPELFIAYGLDHACGWFVQVYTNGSHVDTCECPQCDYDLPALDLDFAGDHQTLLVFVERQLSVEVADALELHMLSEGVLPKAAAA